MPLVTRAFALLGLAATGWMFCLVAPVAAQSTPSAVEARCAEMWGTDVEALAYCKKKRLKALERLRESSLYGIGAGDATPPPKAATPSGTPKNWAAQSDNASEITGNIQVYDDAVSFENGNVLKIEKISQDGSQVLFRVSGENNAFAHKNDECGSDDAQQYMILRESSGKELELSLYRGDDQPVLDEGGPQAVPCAVFKYVRADDKVSAPTKSLPDRDFDAIEAFCNISFPPETSMGDWKNCARSQLEAARGLLDLSPPLPNCPFFVVGGRSIADLEYVDKVDLLSCYKMAEPEDRFNQCVIDVLKAPIDGPVVEDSYDAGKIARCFNGH